LRLVFAFLYPIAVSLLFPLEHSLAFSTYSNNMSRIGRKAIFRAFLLSTILLYSFSPGISFLGTSYDDSSLNETDVARKGRPKELFEIRAHNENLLQLLNLEKGPECVANKRKIFNLGLPRTGTLSIVKVLGQYGFRSCHPFAEKSWTFDEL